MKATVGVDLILLLNITLPSRCSPFMLHPRSVPFPWAHSCRLACLNRPFQYYVFKIATYSIKCQRENCVFQPTATQCVSTATCYMLQLHSYNTYTSEFDTSAYAPHTFAKDTESPGKAYFMKGIIFDGIWSKFVKCLCLFIRVTLGYTKANKSQRQIREITLKHFRRMYFQGKS